MIFKYYGKPRPLKGYLFPIKSHICEDNNMGYIERFTRFVHLQNVSDFVGRELAPKAF
jgi:hypothetical protein